MGYTLKELGLKIGVSDATIKRYETGEIELTQEKIFLLSKALEITPTEIMGLDINKETRIKSIPLLGTIAAGTPILATENIEEYFNIDSSIKADFALRIKGDSMIEANINNNDIVFIKQQNCCENGEICAVLIEEEATLKRFYKNENNIILQPANKEYQPIIISDGEVTILGKLVATLHKYDS